MAVEAKSEAHKTTDPYCPSIRATSPNDAPFIFKGRNEFPAGDQD